MDVTKAAERLRRTNKGEFLCNVYETIEAQPMGELYELYQKDKEAVVAAYLAEHPPDSELAIDEAWLRSVGWIWTEAGTGIPNHWAWRGIVLAKFGDGWRVQIGGNENLWEHFAEPTRGNLRLLCRALGIQLATP